MIKARREARASQRISSMIRVYVGWYAKTIQWYDDEDMPLASTSLAYQAIIASDDDDRMVHTPIINSR
jgi:hypothetical protein